jgi:hypothetical protein
MAKEVMMTASFHPKIQVKGTCLLEKRILLSNFYAAPERLSW